MYSFSQYNHRQFLQSIQFIQDFEGSIRRVVEYLGLDVIELEVKQKYYKRTADDFSEQWVQRFRKEFQEQMGHEIW